MLYDHTVLGLGLILFVFSQPADCQITVCMYACVWRVLRISVICVSSEQAATAQTIHVEYAVAKGCSKYCSSTHTHTQVREGGSGHSDTLEDYSAASTIRKVEYLDVKLSLW